ncbi:F0F1 ATP synthase subunit gamma, partial [Acinetobacter baumannii]|nr:F0F1 ATP synthase subunit gamma [Acinetobacter baumannii]MCW1766164.1 F0F1 ATP synthase subunit gamma [Acinetobacter baumannii]
VISCSSMARPEDVVFGVDGDGIYLQRNVYLKGNMRIDGLGKKLVDGLRGSVQLAASGSFWSDATARQAVWQALGNSGSAPNTNHLVVGDAVTISNGSDFTQTRHWMGTAWLIPAAVLNGDLLVDGTVAARKVDTRGLTVRDNAGNVISEMKLVYNKTRQAAITTELSEIVAGAAAV